MSRFKQLKTAIHDNRYLLIILLIQSIASLFLVYNLDLWIDEATSLKTSSFSASKVWDVALNFESQAPLYYLILHYWLLPLRNIFFARLLSILPVLCSTVLFYKLLMQFDLKKKTACLFTLYFATNTFVLFTAINIRYYGLSLLLSEVIIYMFIKNYLFSLGKISNRLVFILVTVCAIYIQYYLAFLLFAGGVVLLFMRPFKVSKLYILDMIVPVVSLLFLMNSLPEQIATYLNYVSEPHSIFSLIKFMASRIGNYIIAAFNIWHNDYLQRPTLLIAILLIASIFYFNRKTSFRLTPPYIAILIMFAVLIACFAVLFLIFGQSFLYIWHTLAIFVPLMLVFSIILHLDKKVYLIYLLFGLLYTVNIIGIVDYKYAPDSTYIGETIDYIEKNEKENEPILLFRNELEVIFGFQYNGINTLTGIPNNIDFNKGFDHNQWALKSTGQVDSCIRSTVKSVDQRFWLVNMDNFKWVYNVDYQPELLKEYIDSNCVVLKDSSIYDLRIRLMVLDKKD